MSLPSYEEATAKPDPWVIIANRMPAELLTTLALVSKHLNEICTPIIWFDPTSRILSKQQHNLVYDNLFSKIQHTPLKRRRLVTVMNFSQVKLRGFLGFDERPVNMPPHGQVVSKWVSLFERHYPCLKFIILDDLNNAAAVAKTVEPRPTTSRRGNGGFSNVADRIDPQLNDNLPSGPSQPAIRENVSEPIHYAPVLLSMARSWNILPVISNRVESLHNLIYLDLSWSIGEDIGKCLEMPRLKILKLQGLNLDNDDITIVAKTLGTQLFSLDVSSNKLTDVIVPILLENCFKQSRARRGGENPTTRRAGERFSSVATNDPLSDVSRYVEEAPAYRESADPTEGPESRAANGGIESRPDQLTEVMAELCRSDRLKSIQGPTGLPQEGDSFMRHTGLTHLHISDNRMTSNALRQLLLFSDATQVLDIGTVVRYENPLGAQHPNIYPLSQPAIAELLDRTISPHLESLRVHHSVVTETPSIVTKGDFYLSPRRAVKLAEEEFSLYERQPSGSTPFRPFSPDTNPRIRNLTLTDVPTQSQGRIIDAILDTMREASIQEASIAAAMPQDTRRGASMLPGLRRLCLEFAAPAKDPSSSNTTAGPSVSGDRDADNFMAESSRDFSFFDGENGDWSRSASASQSPAAYGEAEDEPDFSFFSDETPTPRKASITSSVASARKMVRPVPSYRSDDAPLYDVRSEIQKHRDATKAAYEAERERLGGVGVVVPPGAPHFHWTGELQMMVRDRGGPLRRV